MGFWNDRLCGGVNAVFTQVTEEVKWREGSCNKPSTPFGKVSNHFCIQVVDIRSRVVDEFPMMMEFVDLLTELRFCYIFSALG